MSETQYTRKQDLYIIRNVGKESYEAIGRQLGRSRHQIRGRYLCLLEGFTKWVDKIHNEAGFSKADDSDLHFKRETSESEDVITCVDPDIKTPEELIAHCKIDLKVWKIERCCVNRWGGFAKTRTYKAAEDDWRRQLSKLALWQVKIHLKRISDDEIATAEMRQEIISALSKHSPKYPPVARPPEIVADDALMAEVSIPDHHFGKLAWPAETGNGPYDLKIASLLFRQAVNAHAAQLRSMRVEKILFPIGNDLFHTDNDKDQTNAGTPQHTDSRWQKAWKYAREEIVYAIDLLREIAKVHVIVIPGNHDRTKTWYFGDVISSWYRLDPEVTVDNSERLRKYVEWGQVLLGFTHGNEEKHQSLPGIMAQEEKEAWARTNHREYHLGHLHTRREWRYNAGDTLDGVHIRVLPSLCEADAWHSMMGYIHGPRASEMYLWRKRTGFAGLSVHKPLEIPKL